jgi:putative inorganic carbon (HCO3(-)) transporter
MLNIVEQLLYWAIILLPFGMAISNGMMNTFLGMIIAAFLIKKLIKKEPVFAQTRINIALLAFFIIVCFAAVNTINFKDSFKGGILRILQYIIVLFALIDGVKDKKHVLRIVVSIGLSLLLISVDSIWQVITGIDFIRGNHPVLNIGLVRATASFSDSNVLGIYLSALAPLLIGLTLYYFKGREKLSFGIITLLALASIFLTYSRPTLLAIYLVFLFFAIARKSKALITVLLVFILIAPFLAPKSVRQWAKEVDYHPVRFMCNDDRIAVYFTAVNMIKASPIIGHGPNTFNKNYKNYKNYPEYRNIVTPDNMYAHNNYLHMTAEIGILGFGIFIWLLFEFFVSCVQIIRKLKDNFLNIVSLSLTACLFSFLVNGLTESSLYYSRVALIFWYLIGFSLSLKKFTQESV